MAMGPWCPIRPAIVQNREGGRSSILWQAAPHHPVMEHALIIFFFTFYFDENANFSWVCLTKTAA